MDIHILVDGLGWEVSRDLAAFDFLDGARRPLETILGFSSAAIPTILTGRMPEGHGAWNLFQLDPERTDFPLLAKLGGLCPLVDRSRIARKLVLEANRLWTGFKGYYQAYEVPAGLLSRMRICERGNLYQAQGEGPQENVFDGWNRAGESWISASWRDGVKTDEQVLAVARSKIARSHPRRVFVYLAGYDAFGHHNAGNPPAMRREAGRIAGLLREFLAHCRRLEPDSNMSVFSDHGMLPLEGTVDLRDALSRLRGGKDRWTVVLDATMARFWWHGDAKTCRLEVEDALRGLPGHFLTDFEQAFHQIRFGGAYGEAIWLADPGIQIVPSHMASVPLGGMHGYDPSHPSMKASFLSTRPSDMAPEAIWEIRDWMEARLGEVGHPSLLEAAA